MCKDDSVGESNERDEQFGASMKAGNIMASPLRSISGLQHNNNSRGDRKMEDGKVTRPLNEHSN